MRLPWRHEDPDRAAEGSGAPRPSPEVPSTEATDRLAGRLRREIDDLHAELADDLLLAMLLLGEDEADGALGMLDDGSDRLQRFQGRLEGVIAEAAVEREAEAVLAGASTSPEPRPQQRSVSGAFRIRALASAAAAILAAVVGLVSLEPTGSPDLLAAGSSSAPAATDPSPQRAGESERVDRPSAPTVSSSTASPTTPRQRLQALIGQQSQLLVRLGSEPRRSAVAELFGVDHLVAQLASEAAEVPSVIASVVPSMTADDLPLGPSEDTEEGSEPQEPEPTTEPAPTKEPADEPSSAAPTEEETPSEETSDEGSDTPSEDTSEEDGDDTTAGIPGDATSVGNSGGDASAPSELLP